MSERPTLPWRSALAMLVRQELPERRGAARSELRLLTDLLDEVADAGRDYERELNGKWNYRRVGEIAAARKRLLAAARQAGIAAQQLRQPDEAAAGGVSSGEVSGAAAR